MVKEAGLAAHLAYDDYERRSGLLRVLAIDASAASWGAGGRDELGDLATGQFRVVRVGPNEAVVARDGAATIDGQTYPLSIETTIQLSGHRLDPRLRWSTVVVNRGAAALVARLGVEWATTMLGGGGNPQAWWDLAGARGAHDGSGAAQGVSEVGQGNSWLGVDIRTSVEPAADAWYAPIETVSNSEAGFERVYQGSALLLSWPVSLPPTGRWSVTVEHHATVAIDLENPSARGLRTTG